MILKRSPEGEKRTRLLCWNSFSRMIDIFMVWKYQDPVLGWYLVGKNTGETSLKIAWVVNITCTVWTRLKNIWYNEICQTCYIHMKCINKHAEQMPDPYANQQLFHQHIENIRSHLAKFKGSNDWSPKHYRYWWWFRHSGKHHLR